MAEGIALEIFAVIFLGGIIGGVILKFISKKTKILDKLKEKRNQRNLNPIINDPKKLKEKLEENGAIVDMGEEVSFNIVKGKDGKDVLEESRKEYKPTIHKTKPLKKEKKKAKTKNTKKAKTKNTKKKASKK